MDKTTRIGYPINRIQTPLTNNTEKTMNDHKETEIDAEIKKRIQERVLEAEKSQLHLDRPHNIIPEIKEIIESEVEEVKEVSYETDRGNK